MPSKGPKPKSLPAWHPDRHVRRLKRGKIDLNPELVPTFVAFLEMLATRYNRARATLLGKCHGMDPATFQGTADRLARLSETITTLSLDLFKPQSGAEFLEAVQLVEQQMDSGKPELAEQPARSSGRSVKE